MGEVFKIHPLYSKSEGGRGKNTPWPILLSVMSLVSVGITETRVSPTILQYAILVTICVGCKVGNTIVHTYHSFLLIMPRSVLGYHATLGTRLSWHTWHQIIMPHLAPDYQPGKMTTQWLTMIPTFHFKILSYYQNEDVYKKVFIFWTNGEQFCAIKKKKCGEPQIFQKNSRLIAKKCWLHKIACHLSKN